MGDTLSVRSIDFTNFRGFANGRLDLDPQVTVLVADNGGGKTATLDALTIALGSLIPVVRGRRRKDAQPQRGLDLTPSDAWSSEVLPPYEHSAYPVGVQCEGEVRGSPVSWGVTLDGAGEQPRIAVPPQASDLASPRVMAERPAADLPVVAYYGTARATGSVSSQKLPSLGPIQRSLGYKNALTPNASYAEVTSWLAQTEWERTSARGTPWEPVLYAIYEATTRVLSPLHASAVYYSLEQRDLIVEFDLGRSERRSMPMSIVSDGFRAVLALVADLAFRCGALNAHFDAEAPQLTDGVVLIDEIDMHLHPKWQAQIVNDLCATFPRIQFVMTTHSPLVVSSIDGSRVRTIIASDGRSEFLPINRQTKGADIDFITEAVFDAPTRGDSDFARDLRELSEMLEQDDLARAAEPAERVRIRLGDVVDFDGDRLVREYDWRVSKERER